MTQQGISGQARHAGIPAATIQWTGQKTGGASRQATIFSAVAKDQQADRATTRGNDGETDTVQIRNVRTQVQLTCIPVGANKAAALAIISDLPKLLTVATITCTGDDQVDSPTGGTTVIQEASAEYDPENDGTISFTVENWPGKVFAAIT